MLPVPIFNDVFVPKVTVPPVALRSAVCVLRSTAPEEIVRSPFIVRLPVGIAVPVDLLIVRLLNGEDVIDSKIGCGRWVNNVSKTRITEITGNVVPGVRYLNG